VYLTARPTTGYNTHPMLRDVASFRAEVICGISVYLAGRCEVVCGDVAACEALERPTNLVRLQEDLLELEGGCRNTSNFANNYILSELKDVLHCPCVAYETTSTAASGVFALMAMGGLPWIRAVHRPQLCRWLWDNWSSYSSPWVDLEATWSVIHTIYLDFTGVLARTRCILQMPGHPVPLPCR
jgi:hypothetical protein